MDAYSGYDIIVPTQWIDVNGHMNASFYYELFYDAGIAFATHIGLGLEYPARCGKGQVVVESHTRFENENMLGDRLRVISRVTNFDSKRLHYFHEMQNLTRGHRSATMEQLELHVDIAARRTTAFSEELLRNFSAVMELQPGLPVVSDIGRMVEFGRPETIQTEEKARGDAPG